MVLPRLRLCLALSLIIPECRRSAPQACLCPQPCVVILHSLFDAQPPMDTQAVTANREHLEKLVGGLRSLEDRLRLGGGPERIAREHSKGKLTARERIQLLFDEDSYFQEIGLLVAHDLYNGQAPAAGVVTGIGRIAGREAAVVANDATVKAGSWWPETVRKVLRAQEI